MEQTREYESTRKLEVVKLVVRYPLLIFCAILSVCLGFTAALYVRVLSEGSPFSPLGKEMDQNDIRSIHYNSLNMARSEVISARNEARALPVPRQSEVEDSTYWVFEAQDDERGLFTDAEAIESMMDTFDIFYADEEFQQTCLLNSEDECDPPLSPLRMYYASSWDSAMVQSVIDDLKDLEKVDLFNSLGWCYALELNCETAPTNVSQSDIDFVKQLSDDVSFIMDSWDMKGGLIGDYEQATELVAHLLQTEIFKPALDFGYDKEFSVANQISKFSRGIVSWASPVENDDGDGVPARDRIQT